MPKKTCSYQDYTFYLKKYLGSEKINSKVDFWLKSKTGEDLSIPVDYPEGKCENWSISGITCRHDINEACQKFALSNTEISLRELIITVFVLAYGIWSSRKTLYVDIVDNGRSTIDIEDSPDISRTVGWLAILCPTIFKLPSFEMEQKEKFDFSISQVRNYSRDNSFGLLRYCHPDEGIRKKMVSLELPRVMFNYAGSISLNKSTQKDEPSIIPYEIKDPRSKNEKKENGDKSISQHQLINDCSIVNGSLKNHWRYSSELHDEKTIRELDRIFTNELIKYLKEPG